MKTRGLALLAALSLIPSAALANWTATGRFVYVDRSYDQTGFTGPEPQMPIRFADVQILDSKNKVLANGSTDANGNYSIFVVDNSNRTVYARVTTRTLNSPTLFLDVQDKSSGKISYYSVRTANVSGHNPNTNVNFGTIAAAKGQGGEAFNIFDQLVRGADYVAHLTGSRPGSEDNLKAVWAANRGVTDSSYLRFSRLISVRDTAGYDDTTLLHEMGHFFIFQYSATDSPDLSHTFSNCNVDIRLAYEEGFASYWGNASLCFAGLAGCNIYMRSNGGPAGPGSLVRYADLETDTQYLCDGATSEVSVFAVLWDINDSASTPDTSPGSDDGDGMATGHLEVWQVQRDHMTSAVNKSLEDFWDGWHAAPISNGALAEMIGIFDRVDVEYVEDASEVNDGIAAATPLAVGGGAVAATFFSDPDGDGAGQSDADYYVFSASQGAVYAAETLGLLSDANTQIELLDTDGSSVLALNNDRAAGNESSLITWTAPATGDYYLRVTHAPDWGSYGSYSVRVSQQ
ncbi:MAG TPA: PPC domain-containing protein [Candidatus Polarisedimenticolia bacterium]|nr:PPC domain-containing protein [Candidatus Polarisedimenticolia bacterium]